MKVTNKKIGVLMGGMSSEREVSLSSGRAVLAALLEKGYDPVDIDAGRDAARQIRKAGVELAFNALHGKYGEDGAIQGVLEVLGIPYTGSGILASAMGMNKIVSKMIFRNSGLSVGPYAIVPLKERGRVQDALKITGLPAVVKPSCEGSSVGISLINRDSQLAAAAELAFGYDEKIIVEKYIRGKEVQVGILGDRALGAIEIVPKEEFYNYRAKYEKGMSEHFFPARIPETAYKRTLEAGLAAHRSLGCRGYSRVDFIVDESRLPFILEVNTLPGMTSTSLLPEIAAGVGISFPDLVEDILRLALEER